jgi:putative transposase
MSYQKVVKPEARKQAVDHMITEHNLSERAACRLASLSRSGYRYQPKARNDDGLRRRLRELAAKQTAYGYLFLHRLLKNEGLVVNKKRTYRTYTEEGLQARTKKRKKLQRARQPMIVPVERDQRWSMDFVSDQLSNGRRFRVLNLIGDYSREVIDQLVSFSISGQQVARFWIKLLSLELSP